MAGLQGSYGSLQELSVRASRRAAAFEEQVLGGFQVLAAPGDQGAEPDQEVRDLLTGSQDQVLVGRKVCLRALGKGSGRC